MKWKLTTEAQSYLNWLGWIKNYKYKDRLIGITQFKEKEEQRMKKNQQSLKDVGETMGEGLIDYKRA